MRLLILTALMAVLPLSAHANNKNWSTSFWQLQGGTIICASGRDLLRLLDQRTASGIQIITSGCQQLTKRIEPPEAWVKNLDDPDEYVLQVKYAVLPGLQPGQVLYLLLDYQTHPKRLRF